MRYWNLSINHTLKTIPRGFKPLFFMLIFAAMVHNEHFFHFVSALYKTEPSHIKGFGLKSSVTCLKNVFGVIVL